MKIHHQRIEKAQVLMKQQGMLGLMIMNHDDYQFFFGETRVQPRAIIPVIGEPIFICFSAEEDEIRSALGTEGVKIFTHVGEQMSIVKNTFQSLLKELSPALEVKEGEKLKVGMQMWFQTPAFLVDLFRKINKRIELVPSDPVMNELRIVKEEGEIELLTRAQEIAAEGMDCLQEMLKPGRTGHEIATEVTYVMMKAGASGPAHLSILTPACAAAGFTAR